MAKRFRRVWRALVGTRPRMIFFFVLPTIIAIVMDFMIRARALVVYPPLEIANYTGSSLAAFGFWGGPLWLISRLFGVRGRRRIFARIAIGLFFAVVVFPLSVFCFPGQALYHRVFASYMARDTVRLGIALRGTLADWLFAWGSPLVVVAMIFFGALVTYVIFRGVRRAAPFFARATPIIPILGFCGCTFCFWIDFVESRSLQAAPPDTCFIHGVMHALHDGLTGKGWVRRGISLRTPAPLPNFTPKAHRPNVIVIITESVRADVTCSDPPPKCASQFLDPVASDRVPLGKLTTESPGTFSACMLLWTGLRPTVDFQTAHSAPVLWEIAKASGYHTGYVTSQNLRYDDFGVFVKRAGIDELVTAMDLGATKDAQIGAPDERATARMLDVFRDAPKDKPFFGILHFSNTHAPYQVDPDLQPYSPHSTDVLGDINAFHNQYRNSVLLQERTLAAFLKELRAMPRWDETVVIFLSDHGEQFREHGGLYHIHTLFDEEVRVPGWLLSGKDALSDDQRLALRTWAHRRTYSEDVNATVVDLVGAAEARASFPYADIEHGRSLVMSAPRDEPVVPMSTATGVWEPDLFAYGVMRGEQLVEASPGSSWSCFEISRDPREVFPKPGKTCGSLYEEAKRMWPSVGVNP